MVEHKVFAEGVAKDIRKYLSPANADVECAVVEQRKNNGQMCVGISFTKPGQPVPPIIYMEPFYEKVRCGEPLESIVREIVRSAEESMETGIPDCYSHISEYDRVKGYLGVRLVNTKANRGELARIPHRELEDLSLIPVIRFPLPDADGYGSTKVTEEIRKGWGIGAEQLFEQALENEELPCMHVLGEFMSDMDDSRQELFQMEDGPFRITEESMFILTNERKVDGAAVIAFPGVMEKLDELFPEGFFVVPSSIHETIIMPKGGREEISPKEMGKMVRDINRTCMEKTEILSDRIYEYDKENRKLRQVPESIQKERGMDR